MWEIARKCINYQKNWKKMLRNSGPRLLSPQRSETDAKIYKCSGGNSGSPFVFRRRGAALFLGEHLHAAAIDIRAHRDGTRKERKEPCATKWHPSRIEIQGRHFMPYTKPR
jgi:hypothetical protein